jgi:hypothetical protein
LTAEKYFLLNFPRPPLDPPSGRLDGISRSQTTQGLSRDILFLSTSHAFQNTSLIPMPTPPNSTHQPTSPPLLHFSIHQETCPCITKTLEEIWDATMSPPRRVPLGPRSLGLPMSTRANLAKYVAMIMLPTPLALPPSFSPSLPPYTHSRTSKFLCCLLGILPCFSMSLLLFPPFLSPPPNSLSSSPLPPSLLPRVGEQTPPWAQGSVAR